MSNTEGESRQPERPAFRDLDAAVGRLIDAVAEARARAQEAERRSADSAEVVKRFTGDDAAAEVLARLPVLEAENADLKARLERGREGIERLLARIKFLEEQR